MSVPGSKQEGETIAPIPMDPATLAQARAMIIWGESTDVVSRFLLSNDVSARETEECLALLKAERHREVRKTGIRKLLVGALALGMSACGLVLLWDNIQDRSAGRRGGGGLFVLLLLGLFFGIGKVVDGLIYLIRPQLESKAISEISD
jgi:hypothetical protein